MAIGQSTWYVDVNGGIARVDVDAHGVARWTASTDLHELFPALPCFGTSRWTTSGAIVSPGALVGAQQTGPDEFVFDVHANGWQGIFPNTWDRPVRVDMLSGAVVQYKAPFDGRTIHAEGWREYFVTASGAQAGWRIVNTVTQTRIEPPGGGFHPWADAVFTLPTGARVGLPPGGTALGLDRGRLFVKLANSAWGYQIFDLDNLTTDGVTYGDGPAPGSVPAGYTRLWSAIADPESWHRLHPAGEVGRDVLEAIAAAATAGGVSAKELMSVMNAESGLRTTAFHPAGRYGLLQLTADQLRAAGWTGTPDEYLTAGAGQLPVIGTYLRSLAIPADIDDTGLWIWHLLLPADRAAFDPTKVIAAPGGPRADLFASHGVADMDGDGRLMATDLQQYLRSLRSDSRQVELQERLLRLGPVTPG
jgi:hypothetical protein